MAAFESLELLILQSSLSGVIVLFIFPGMCYFNFCLSPVSISEIVSRNKARPMRNMQVLFGLRYGIPESWLHLRKTANDGIYCSAPCKQSRNPDFSHWWLLNLIGRVEVINPWLPSLY